MALERVVIHMQVNQTSSDHTKINSKWIIYNVRDKTIILLKENIEISICDPGLGNGFLDVTHTHIHKQITKEKQINQIHQY